MSENINEINNLLLTFKCRFSLILCKLTNENNKKFESIEEKKEKNLLSGGKLRINIYTKNIFFFTFKGGENSRFSNYHLPFHAVEINF